MYNGVSLQEGECFTPAGVPVSTRSPWPRLNCQEMWERREARGKTMSLEGGGGVR